MTYSNETRQRIIDAAHISFSKSGFDATSIRQIVALAGTNIASVNYHFGGKDALYTAVIEKNFEVISRNFENAFENISAENFDTEFRAFIARRISAGLRDIPDQISRMIGWELINPKLDIIDILENKLEPTRDQLITLLEPLFGPQTTKAQKTFAARWFFVYTAPPPPLIEAFWDLVGPDPDDATIEQASLRMADAAIATVKALTAPPASP